MTHKFDRVQIFYRPDIVGGSAWEKKIIAKLKSLNKKIEIGSKRPKVVIALGGDGTIMEAIRNFKHFSPLFIGLNLGHVGFLATIREKRNFLKGIEKIYKGEYTVSERMMLHVGVMRKGKEIYQTQALGDMYIQNLTGLLDLDIHIDEHLVQHVHGTGAIASTASGSTAYNLSLHGPIVMPDINCIVVNEILDHNTPTPSMIIKKNKRVSFHIKNFRQRKEVLLAKDGQDIDVGMWTDGVLVMRLLPGDIVHVSRARGKIKLAEIEKDYFFKSIQQKFTFK